MFHKVPLDNSSFSPYVGIVMNDLSSWFGDCQGLTPTRIPSASVLKIRLNQRFRAREE